MYAIRSYYDNGNLSWIDHGIYLQDSSKSNAKIKYLVNTIWQVPMVDSKPRPGREEDEAVQTGWRTDLQLVNERTRGRVQLLARLGTSVMLYPGEQAVVPIYLESLYPVGGQDIIELTPIPDVVEFTQDPTHILIDIEAVNRSGLIFHNRTDLMFILDHGEIVATGAFRDKKEKHWIMSEAAVVSAATQMGTMTEHKINCVRELEREIRAELIALRDGRPQERPADNRVLV